MFSLIMFSGVVFAAVVGGAGLLIAGGAKLIGFIVDLWLSDPDLHRKRGGDD